MYLSRSRSQALPSGAELPCAGPASMTLSELPGTRSVTKLRAVRMERQLLDSHGCKHCHHMLDDRSLQSTLKIRSGVSVAATILDAIPQDLAYGLTQGVGCLTGGATFHASDGGKHRALICRLWLRADAGEQVFHRAAQLHLRHVPLLRRHYWSLTVISWRGDRHLHDCAHAGRTNKRPQSL